VGDDEAGFSELERQPQHQTFDQLAQQPDGAGSVAFGPLAFCLEPSGQAPHIGANVTSLSGNIPLD
jgi:hypothetical protein